MEKKQRYNRERAYNNRLRVSTVPKVDYGLTLDYWKALEQRYKNRRYRWVKDNWVALKRSIPLLGQLSPSDSFFNDSPTGENDINEVNDEGDVKSKGDPYDGDTEGYVEDLCSPYEGDIDANGAGKPAVYEEKAKDIGIETVHVEEFSDIEEEMFLEPYARYEIHRDKSMLEEGIGQVRSKLVGVRSKLNGVRSKIRDRLSDIYNFRYLWRKVMIAACCSLMLLAGGYCLYIKLTSDAPIQQDPAPDLPPEPIPEADTGPTCPYGCEDQPSPMELLRLLFPKEDDTDEI